MGDVGTHMLYLTEAICPQLNIKRVMCSKQSFVEGRMLEDNAMSIMEYDNGAIGYIWSSGVNAGEQFGFRIRIVGEKASVAWDAEKPNYLSYEVQGESPRMLSRGNGYLYPEALADDRIGGGHRKVCSRLGATCTLASQKPSTRPTRARRSTSGTRTFTLAYSA